MATETTLTIEMYEARTRALIAYASLAAALVAFLTLCFAPISESARPTANTLGTVFITTCLAFYGYYYSASSKDKKSTDNSTNTVIGDNVDTKNIADLPPTL